MLFSDLLAFLFELNADPTEVKIGGLVGGGLAIELPISFYGNAKLAVTKFEKSDWIVTFSQTLIPREVLHVVFRKR